MDELYEYLKKRVERLEEIGKCIPEHEIFNQTIHQAKLSEVLRVQLACLEIMKKELDRTK